MVHIAKELPENTTINIATINFSNRFRLFPLLCILWTCFGTQVDVDSSINHRDSNLELILQMFSIY